MEGNNPLHFAVDLDQGPDTGILTLQERAFFKVVVNFSSKNAEIFMKTNQKCADC